MGSFYALSKLDHVLTDFGESKLWFLMSYENFAKHWLYLNFNFKGGQFYSLNRLDHVLTEFREHKGWKLWFLMSHENMAKQWLYLNINFKRVQFFSLIIFNWVQGTLGLKSRVPKVLGKFGYV